MDDSQKMQQIVDILPETALREFANELLSGTRYRGRYNQMFDQYEEEISKSKLFVFDNPELQRRYREFDLVVSALDFMRANHFFPTKEGVFELYPGTEGAEDAELKKLRVDKHAEVVELANLLSQKYNALLVQSRKSPAVLTPEHITKMEITAMPEIQMRKMNDDGAIIKGRARVYPPKFPDTDWPKITIRFISEQDVFITAGAKSAQSNYEALGFADGKRDKPNAAWGFLLGLAKNNGETAQLKKPIEDTVKQQKKKLSDRLKSIFNNGTDPFFDPSETQTYRIKINLIPPAAPEQPDMLGVRDYLSESTEE